MATKLRCARFLVYSAAEQKEAHVPYGMEAAMAKMYASDIALEVTNDALQIHGGAGFMKGMEVERAYRDAKITTGYEGTNEIQRVVIASHILGKPPLGRGRFLQPAQEARTGHRGAQRSHLPGRHPQEQVAALVEHLKKDGHDFSVGIPMDTPINQAERVVSAGKGIGGAGEHGPHRGPGQGRRCGHRLRPAPWRRPSNTFPWTAMWECPARSLPETCTSPTESPARCKAPEGHQGRLDHRGDQQNARRPYFQKL